MNARALRTAIVILNVISFALSYQTGMLSAKPQMESHRVQLLIERIQVQVNFETVLYLKQTRTCRDVFIEDAIDRIATPKVVITDDRSIYLRGTFDQRVLAVVCVEPSNVLYVLHNLTQSLQHMRSTQTVVVINEGATYITERSLTEVFKYCEKMQMLNVIAIDRDFSRTANYYSYHKFPDFQLEYHKFQDSNENSIFPARLRNIFGYPLRTLPEGTRPRTIIYRDRNGTIRVSGYIWEIVKEFVRAINGTLHLPFPVPLKIIFYQDMLHYTRNNSLDIAATASSPLFLRNLHELSYPITLTSWCIMLPIEREISRNDIISYLMGSTSSRVMFGLQFIYGLLLSSALCLFERGRRPNYFDLLLNDVSFRGMLGQSFPFTKHPKLTLGFTLMLICFTGLFYTNIYSAQYQAFLTRPPHTKPISSLEDLYNSQSKILITKQEYGLVPREKNEYISGLFEFTDDISTFYEERNKFNTSYGYSVPGDRWLVYKQQQEYFDCRIFRITDICFIQTTSMSIILPENSIYKERLDHFINQLNSAGLLSLWMKESFYQMLQAGEVFFNGCSVSGIYKATELKDCLWIIECYAITHAICIVCFCFELMAKLLKKS